MKKDVSLISTVSKTICSVCDQYMIYDG